ncbi:MAG: DUF4350 domain-containing protein, partial [Anaerolineae bacterium]
MLKKILAIALALIVVVTPLVARWFYFYEGRYEPGEVPRPDLSEIQAPPPQIESFVDHRATPTHGTILVDMAHDNRLKMTELRILQARLSARGQRFEEVKTTQDLPGQLRYAKALVVICPGQDWSADEIRQVQEFVDRGGRLLLVTDPTRFAVEFNELDLPVLDSDAPHINDLAAQFDLLFQTDYLYNTVENEGNFRNIKLTDFGEDDLTQGLDQVVFYAAHSIISEKPALIAAGGETRSSNSERTGEL